MTRIHISYDTSPTHTAYFPSGHNNVVYDKLYSINHQPSAGQHTQYFLKYNKIYQFKCEHILLFIENWNCRFDKTRTETSEPIQVKYF